MNGRIHCIKVPRMYMFVLIIVASRTKHEDLLTETKIPPQLMVLKSVTHHFHPCSLFQLQTFEKQKVLISDKSSCVYDQNKLFAFPRESFKLSFACHLPSFHLSPNSQKIKTKRKNMRHRRIVMFFICRRQSDEKLIP